VNLQRGYTSIGDPEKEEHFAENTQSILGSKVQQLHSGLTFVKNTSAGPDMCPERTQSCSEAAILWRCLETSSPKLLDIRGNGDKEGATHRNSSSL
jgi:hypothetical protein